MNPNPPAEESTMPTPTPPGFAPRTGIKPLWMHTIELDPDRSLVGIVVVVHREYLPAVAQLLECAQDGMQNLVVHASGEERWLRLDRAEALRLRYALGKQRGDEPEHIPGAYHALVDVENIVDREDD